MPVLGCSTLVPQASSPPLSPPPSGSESTAPIVAVTTEVEKTTADGECTPPQPAASAKDQREMFRLFRDAHQLADVWFPATLGRPKSRLGQTRLLVASSRDDLAFDARQVLIPETGSRGADEQLGDVFRGHAPPASRSSLSRGLAFPPAASPLATPPPARRCASCSARS